MKKVVRILGLFALVALAITSCKKEQQPTELTFTATINQPVNPDKTHIGQIGSEEWLVWDANNTIKVFNAEGEEGDFSTTDHDVDVATFTGTLTPTSTYTAFYPNAAVNGNAVTLTLNANQNYVNSNFGNDTYPMAAAGVENNNGGINFPFHSPASVLRLQLSSDHTCTVKTIILTGATGNKLAGDIVYSNFNNVSDYSITNATNVITMDCGNDGVDLVPGETTAFNIVLLAGTLSAGTTVVVKDMGNHEITTLTMTQANTIPEEYIYTMPLKKVDYELITVYTDDPENITSNGATMPGHYEAPAGSTVSERGFYWSTNASLVDAHDASCKQACTGTSGTPFSFVLTGLEPGTYYYMAYAVNNAGENWGSRKSFTIAAPIPPTVVTLAAFNVNNPAGSAMMTGGYLANDYTITKLGFYYGTSTSALNTYVEVPAGSLASPFTYTLTSLAPGTYYYKACVKTNTNVEYVANNTESFVIPEPLPAIPGAFSTSPTRMVVFAHANLQYNVNPNASQGSTTNPLWRFAEHQWDFLGEPTNVTNAWNRLAYYWKSVFDGIGTFTYEDLANMYVTSHNYLALYAYEYQNAPSDFTTADGKYWIDLFCWGATGYDIQSEPWNFRRDFYLNGTGGYFKSDPNGVPMATFVWGNGSSTQHPGEQQGSSYTKSWYVGNSTYDIPNNTNLSDFNNNFDWGYYCDIYNPTTGTIDPAGTWRTLTGSYHGDANASEGEWYYLMHCRTTANGQASVVNGQQDARWCKARINVNGTYIRGLILFPDVYEHPSGVAGPNNINRRGDITCDDAGNDYTTAEWALMEAAGAEFLPCASTRYGWGIKEWCYDPAYGVSSVSHSALLDRSTADNTEGYYWSSTSRYAANAGDLRFLSRTADYNSEDPDVIGNVDGGNNYDRDLGCAVRLAKTVRE